MGDNSEPARVAELAREARGAVVDQKGGPALVAELPPVSEGGFGAEAGARVETILGRVGDEVMGYGLLVLPELGDDSSEPVATLREIYVVPGARSVGVGGAILAEARRLAAESGCQAIDSVSLPGDRNTKNFFEDHAMVARKLVVRGHL